MKPLSTLCIMLFSYQCAFSQVDKESPKLTQEEIKAEVVQQLFNNRDKKEFTKAAQEAKKIGLSEQVILEATFLFHVDLTAYDEIIKLTEKFQQMSETFDPNKSKIFSTKEDWQSVIEYGLALKALDEKNNSLFKQHILEAFWLSPDKAGAFAPHINQLHTQAAMQKVKLKSDQKIFQINHDEAISIGKLLENKKALLLRFWSPWSQQAEANFPLTKSLAKQCAQHKISFASILISKDPQGIKDTLEIIEETKNELPSYWLADEDDSNLTKLLRVIDLPTIVIISKEGEILYNGSLHDKALWSTLSKIDPEIKSKL